MKATSKIPLVLAVITTASVVPSPARAQGSSISATADVQTALTVTGTQALSFGAAFPGTARSILASNAACAGHFSLSGSNNAEVR